MSGLLDGAAKAVMRCEGIDLRGAVGEVSDSKRPTSANGRIFWQLTFR